MKDTFGLQGILNPRAWGLRRHSWPQSLVDGCEQHTGVWGRSFESTLRHTECTAVVFDQVSPLHQEMAAKMSRSDSWRGTTTRTYTHIHISIYVCMYVCIWLPSSIFNSCCWTGSRLHARRTGMAQNKDPFHIAQIKGLANHSLQTLHSLRRFWLL